MDKEDKKMCICWCCLVNHVGFFEAQWTTAHQAPLSMGFLRQEYWRGLPFPPPGDLPDARIERVCPESPVWEVDSLPLSHLGSPPVGAALSVSIINKALPCVTGDKQGTSIQALVQFGNYLCFLYCSRVGSSAMIKTDNKVSLLTQVSDCRRFYYLLSSSC